MNEEIFKDIFESMMDVFTRTDLDGKCIIVSPSIYNLIGYTQVEVVGMYLGDLFADPEEKDATIERLLENKAVENFEFEVRHKNGNIITVSTNARIIYDDHDEPKWIDANIRDITRQKQAESEHDKLFNVSFDLIAIAGFDGYFIELNPAWEEVTGYKLKELYSKPFFDFIHPDDLEKTRNEVKELFNGLVTLEFENRYITKSGKEIDLSWVAIPVPEKSKMYCIARDITARKRAEKEIIEYQKRLKGLAHELTIAEERVRKQVAADLHDNVGQLLASIRMQLARISDMEKNPELVIRMNHISESLLKTIQSTRAAIFDLSPPQLEEIGIFAAIHDWMKEQVEKKHRIKTSLTGDEKKFNLDEKTRLLNIRSIKELCVNVSKHAKARKILVEIIEKNNHLEIVVQDDGVGFNYNPDLLSLRRNAYGLFSIQERITDLGGSIDLKSVKNEGTKVCISIPMK